MNKGECGASWLLLDKPRHPLVMKATVQSCVKILPPDKPIEMTPAHSNQTRSNQSDQISTMVINQHSEINKRHICSCIRMADSLLLMTDAHGFGFTLNMLSSLRLLRE